MSDCLGTGIGIIYYQGAHGKFWRNGNVFMMVVVTQVYTFVKSHYMDCIERLKWEHFTTYNLYFFKLISSSFCVCVTVLGLCCPMWALDPLTRMNPGPLFWEHGVLSTGWPGKSLKLIFKKALFIAKEESHYEAWVPEMITSQPAAVILLAVWIHVILTHYPRQDEYSSPGETVGVLHGCNPSWSLRMEGVNERPPRSDKRGGQRAPVCQAVKCLTSLHFY